jgi:Zn-dependent peptidase ImmA (M78 family)
VEIILSIINYFNKQKNFEKPIEYWVADPDLGLKELFIHKDSKLPINVSNYYGGGNNINSSKGRAANCYAVITKCLDNISRKEILPEKWSEVKSLKINPIAGVDLNAYYDRKCLNFFYYFDYKIKQNIYASDSSDIVTHELGHAILDALRPDFWNVQNYEIWALHESYGDIIAILNLLENEQILKIVSKETKNDLSKSNVASKLAEQFAKTVYNVTKGKNNINANCLRDAVNNFIYQNTSNSGKKIF